MNAKPETRRIFTTFVVPIILALTAVVSMLLFQNCTVTLTRERAYQSLADSAQEQTIILREIFDGRFSVLATFANSLAKQPNRPTLENITARMSAIVEASDFENMAVAKTDGVAHTDDGQTDDSSDRFYMTEALAGRRAIQKLTDSRLYGKNRLVLSVPIYKDKKVEGAVMGSFSDMDVQKLLVSSAFSGNAYSFLCDLSGQIIVMAETPLLIQETDNFYEIFADMKLENGATVESIKDDTRNGRSGVVAYSIDNEKRYAVYQPTKINDWYIFNVVSAAVVDMAVARQNRLGFICIGAVSACAVLLLVIMAHRKKRRVSDLKRMQEQQLVYYRTDPVTGLLNAPGFTNAVAEALRALPEAQFCAMLDFGILDFNQYNVSFGSPAGDAVLRSAAQTLRDHCMREQPCACLSSDRFAVLVYDCADQPELLKRIMELDEKLHASDESRQLQLTYGVYIIDDRTLPAETLCDRAAAARLELADSKHRIGVYDHNVHRRQIEDAQLVASMDESLRRGEFIPYYQPKYNARTERAVGAEALVRWIRPDGTIIPPDRYIRLFEQNGLIIRLDLHIFRQVCLKLAAMPVPVPVSVNFSRAHMYAPDFPDTLLKIAEELGAAPRLLEIELTETAFFEQRDVLMQNMNRLRKLGFLVSIDDFGSGYSSLNLLKNVSFDTIKIDREFFSETKEPGRGQIVVKSVLALAKALKVHTVAEGVETREQLEFLRENGCDTIQGYYFSRPMPEAEFDKLLRSQRNASL